MLAQKKNVRFLSKIFPGPNSKLSVGYALFVWTNSILPLRLHMNGSKMYCRKEDLAPSRKEEG